jgi:sigma-B regulation protein RsbU (phosphoserine phosphatase)
MSAPEPMSISATTSGGRFRDRTELLDFLLEVTASTSATIDLDTLLANLARILQNVLPFDLLAILLYSEKRRGLVIRYSQGHSPDMVRDLVIPLEEGITGVAASTRAPVVVGDVRSDPRYLQTIDAVRSEMAIPMIARDRLVGVIDVQSTTIGAFTSEDSALLQLIASRVASSILNARLFRRVDRQNRTLRLLARVAQEFSSLLDLNELLGKVAATVHGLISYDAFSILLCDEHEPLLRHRFSMRYDQRLQFDNIPIGKGITGTSAMLRAPVLVEDTSNDPRYIEMRPGIRSEVSVPLLMADRLIGVMDLESERIAFFTDDHVQTLSLLAPLVAGAVENARLYSKLASNKERLEADLEAARRLQTLLLPKEDPQIAGLEIGIGFRPAHEITGDVFDFFEHGDDYAIICFGDVSGKSAAAALYGAMVTGLLRSLTPRRRQPASLMQTLNYALLERKVESRYLTLMVMLWQPHTKLLTISNAGAIPPMICRAGQVIRPRVEGVPLGLLAGAEHDELAFQTEPGDVVILYSDGISDQHNPEREEYGPRLEEFVQSVCDLPAQKLVDAIFDDFDQFRETRGVFDDQTMLVLKVKE